MVLYAPHAILLSLSIPGSPLSSLPVSIQWLSAQGSVRAPTKKKTTSLTSCKVSATASSNSSRRCETVNPMAMERKDMEMVIHMAINIDI